MTIKINGATAITNSRRGVFRSVNPGSYTTANRPPGASEGDVIYDSDEKNIFIWNGTEWVGTGGGQINNLNPAIPPFTSKSGPEATVTNSDGKVEFSLDGTSWVSSITIPPETIYYCDWTDDILSAAHDSNYETSINVSYPNLTITQDIELELKIDKLPDPFEFTDLVDVDSDTIYTSNTISPLNTINAPTAVWGSSNAVNAQIAIGDNSFQSIPSAPGSLYVNLNTRIRVRHTTSTSALTDYSTTLNIGYGTGAGEFETSTYTTTTLNSVVNQPTITSPGNNDFVDTEALTITSSAFNAENAGTHKSSQWQVASDSAFSNIVEQETSTSELTSWTPSFGLSYVDQVAYVRVRHTGTLNDLTSNWSTIIQITPQQWHLWRVNVSMSGGRGSGGLNGAQAGGGGSGSFTMETPVYSYNPPGSMGSSIGSTANGRNGGGGYASGGTSSDCSDGKGGGGGGSTCVRYNNSVIAVVGGGGGGGRDNSGSGGGGGGINQTGGAGGRYNNASGGSGGSIGTGGSSGGGSGCGFHSGNPDRRVSGGSGGGGGGGGGAGSGNTQDTWEGGGGGGGGGGGWNTAPLGSAWNVISGPSASTGTSGGGAINITLQSSTHTQDGASYTTRNNRTSSGNFDLTTLK